jgi:hypothetical protein
MRSILITFCFLFSLLLSAIPSTSSQTSAPPPLYKPNGNEPVVLGSISVTGDIPAPMTIDMSADPDCMRLNKGKAKTQSVLTDHGMLQNAFVYLESGQNLREYSFEGPLDEVILRRENCQYVPRLLGMRLGQKLRIELNDGVMHNTHPTPKLNVEWNRTTGPDISSYLVAIERAEALIPFKDNQHPWEKAFVSVLKHPFFAITDKLGNYEIRGIPPGTYTLRVWHERLGDQSVELTLIPGELRRADFTFKSSINSWEKKLTYED